MFLVFDAMSVQVEKKIGRIESIGIHQVDKS